MMRWMAATSGEWSRPRLPTGPPAPATPPDSPSPIRGYAGAKSANGEIVRAFAGNEKPHESPSDAGAVCRVVLPGPARRRAGAGRVAGAGRPQHLAGWRDGPQL